MKIEVNPFVEPGRNDNWDPSFPITEFHHLRRAFEMYHGNRVGIMAATDGILAEIVRQSMTGISSTGEKHAGAAMWDVRQISAAFEFELDELTFSEVVSVLEGSDYLTFDSPPIDTPEPHAFAYLDPAGLERGAALLGRYLGVGEFAPASDRVVTLDHNSQAITDIRDRLTEISRVLITSNSASLGSADERDRLREQLAVGARLFSVRNVSVAAVGATAIAALKFLSVTFADEALGRLAGTALDTISKVLGI